MDLRSLQMLEYINTRLSNIEKNISRIDEKLDFSIALQRNHLTRLKNGQFIDDEMILMGRPYNDLTPSEAFKVYQNQSMDFIFLNVSMKNSNQTVEGSIHIPLEELSGRYSELDSKVTPILVISEKGIRSIQACELLVKKGLLNVNNVSGGLEFWPGKSQLRENQI